MSKLSVKQGFSQSSDEKEAVHELAEQLSQPGTQLNIIFASSYYNSDKLGKELKKTFQTPTIGCTTSGEISPKGYSEKSLTGLSIASNEITTHSYLITPIQKFNPAKIQQVVNSVNTQLTNALTRMPEARAFGILLVDGLSIMEEQIVALLAHITEDLPIVGGSAGDDLKFEKTHLYSNGKFISDACIFTLFITTLPFAIVKTQHFSATDTRMVITKATPEKRLVHEINGRPAAREYANLIGLHYDKLEPQIFSDYPVMLRFGGEYYVRSIQKVNPDGSLKFFCAIDEGLVLRVAKGKNIVNNLEKTFNDIRKKIPNIKLTIGFDCILRLLEVKNKNLQSEINRIFTNNNVIGFNTYGEQYNALHVNQTFTGIVLGE